MGQRFRYMICNGTATALLACANAVPAEPPGEARSLTQWVLRAQERLALEPAQRGELRALIDANAARLRELQARYAASDADRGLQRAELTAVQLDFRRRLVAILTPGQLAEWDALVEELLGEVHLRNAPRLAAGLH
jgi:hypothetical protein